MSIGTSDTNSKIWYKVTCMLSLPYEIREKIYDYLEPSIAIEPQYPINIRIALEPDWNPGYRLHPLFGINDIMNTEIKSRYHNGNDTAQTAYFPKKTTFRIWHKQSPLMALHKNAFLNKNKNDLGVRHLEYIFDGYDGSRETDHSFFAALDRFPLLETLKIVLNYRAGRISRQDADSFKSTLRCQLELVFPEGAKMARPCAAEWKRESVNWVIQEYCVLEGEE